MSSSTDDVSSPWIGWFCSLRENEYLCEIDKAFIEDKFNLIGLGEQVPHYRKALERILDLDVDDGFEDSSNSEPDPERVNFVQEAAALLYGLIHARYIMSNRGMAQMLEKYHSGAFEQCQRLKCNGQTMLPIGLSDDPGIELVKLFCPKCEDVYHPQSSHHTTDGAYFGTGFPQMVFMDHPECRPKREEANDEQDNC